MYISVYPVAISMRNSNVYQVKNNGVIIYKLHALYMLLKQIYLNLYIYMIILLKR